MLLVGMSIFSNQNSSNNSFFSKLYKIVEHFIEALDSIEEAIVALRSGRFILVHDDKGRENEVDMVIPAEYVKPEHVSTMRMAAG